MRKKGFSRTQLQYLAIVAMVVDHTAWGFVEFYSPLGQLMHLFGRLTLPIMCFFIAEGFRHTSDLKRYISRMVVFAIVSCIPFYVFFHEEYGYRQNIIFDLLLALLSLTAMECRQLPKWGRIALVALLFVVSCAIGGWVIMPICYTMIFYYGGSFKRKARLFCIQTFLLEVVLIIAILVNRRIHFMSYDWDVYEWLYFLGFMLALVPLYFYNGEKGKKPIGGRYFFYAFYPAHFLVLSFVKYYLLDFSSQRLYILIHVIGLFVTLGTLLYVLTVQNSRAQMATALFLMVSAMYVFGFLIEITTYEVAGVYTATKLQYFATMLCMMSMTYCVSEFCKVRIPQWVYAIETVCSILIMYYMFTVEENGLMYSGISMNYDGPFPRMEIESYGPVFYGYLLYNAVICIGAFAIGVRTVHKKGELAKRRLVNLLYGTICMWIPFLLKATKLLGGYEVPALGIVGAAIFVGRALVKYSYLDSIELGVNNALDLGREGIMVIDNSHHILFHNEFIHKIFGALEDYEDAYQNAEIEAVFEGKAKRLEKNDHIYEMRVEPLHEAETIQGQILWVFDLTEHYRYLSEVEECAATDPLTGINNRRGFENAVNSFITQSGSGAFAILDLDNFKQVNDTYGHQIGDEVLVALSRVILGQKQDVLAGRIGGDEFCLFYRDNLDKASLAEWAQSMIHEFYEELKQCSCGAITSITIGIELLDQREKIDEKASFKRLYKHADRALYLAKEAGKATYRFYHDSKALEDTSIK